MDVIPLRPVAAAPQATDREFLREAYIALLARYPDAAGEAHFLGLLARGGMTRQDVLRALAHSGEARHPGRGLGFTPAPGETRDCTEPWDHFVVKADGDVYPCCSHSPVGRLQGEAKLLDILDGAAARALRQSLLAGRLDPWCFACKSQPVVDARAFRRSLAGLRMVQGRERDEEGCVRLDLYPELARHFAFAPGEGVAGGLSDRITFRTTLAHASGGVTIHGHDPGRPCLLVVDLEHEGEADAATRLDVSLHGGAKGAAQVVLSGSARSSLALAVPAPTGPVAVRYGVKRLDGRIPRATAHFSYPFFDDDA